MARLSNALLVVLPALLVSSMFCALEHSATTTTLAQQGAPASAYQEEEEFYACSMHPDVVSDKPGRCPKCGMTLVRTRRPEITEYDVKLSTNPAVVKAGEKFHLSFLIKHPKTAQTVKDFNIVHDMPFHLFVVSQDLNYFSHIHPAQQKDGSFAIDTVVPKPGPYLIYCDIFPVGGMPQVIHHNLVTAGFNGDLFSAQAQLIPDKVLTKTLDGVKFELKLDPVEPVGGRPATLKYHLSAERTGEPVKDLQPYLGAWGHTLILSEDASEYIHSHPTETIPEGANRTVILGGPDASFDTFFPRPGRYRIWSQFQRAARLTTVSFTINVRRL